MKPTKENSNLKMTENEAPSFSLNERIGYTCYYIEWHTAIGTKAFVTK